MGSVYLVLALIFSMIIAVVAMANTETVTVSYVFGRADVPLILLIIGSALIGALVMGLFSLFRSIRSAFTFRQLRRQKESLQKQVKTLEEEKIFLEAELNKAVSVPEEPEEPKEPEEDVQKKQAEVEETASAEEEEEKDSS